MRLLKACRSVVAYPMAGALLLAAVFVLVPNLRADTIATQADYRLGQQYAGAKQWGAAVRQYLKVLQDDPKALYVYKAVGTAYYQAGDRKGALVYYHRYLAAYPSDVATATFVARLEGSPALAPAETATTTISEIPFGLTARIELGGVPNSGADIIQLYGSGSGASSMGAIAGLGADYALRGGFIGGLDLLWGPQRNYTATYSAAGASTTDTWTVSNLSVFLTPGWRFRVMPKLLVEPRLGLGFMMSNVHATLGSGGAFDAAASGPVFWPQVRGEWLFGKYGVGLNLGYLLASFNPVKDSHGNTVQVYDASGNPSNWSVNNGGISASVYGTYHFNWSL
jgi:hypothetical protein